MHYFRFNISPIFKSLKINLKKKQTHKLTEPTEWTIRRPSVWIWSTCASSAWWLPSARALAVQRGVAADWAGLAAVGPSTVGQSRPFPSPCLIHPVKSLYKKKGENFHISNREGFDCIGNSVMDLLEQTDVGGDDVDADVLLALLEAGDQQGTVGRNWGSQLVVTTHDL